MAVPVTNFSEGEHWPPKEDKPLDQREGRSPSEVLALVNRYKPDPTPPKTRSLSPGCQGALCNGFHPEQRTSAPGRGGGG